MKRIFSILTMAVISLSVVTLVSCGDDNESGNPENRGAAATKADLIGSWDIFLNGAPVLYVFTENNLTITSEWGGESRQIFSGAYAFENSRLSYQIEGAEETSAEINMIYDKNVVLATTIIPADQSYSGLEEKQVSFGYRRGATVGATAADIQGKWYWKESPNFPGVRAVITFTDNKFDMIITPWGERHTGTFTYENGYVHFTVEQSYSTRFNDEDHMNYDDPESSEFRNINDPDVYSSSSDVPDPIMAFIPNGSEAYGTIANLQAKYYKQ